MRLSEALPNSLLALLALCIPAATQHHANPQLEINPAALSPRDAEICRKITTQQPISIRKMSSHDPGEMFYLSDWHFDDYEVSNNTLSAFELPVLPHITHAHNKPFLRPLSRLLSARAPSDFRCPADTTSCSSIGAEYGCCPPGTTCQIGDRGSLGCCPGSAGTCSGNTPTNCPAGYDSCPLYRGGGGCCAVGFQCQSDGCVGVSTTVVVVAPTVTVRPSTSRSSTPSSTSATSTSTSSSSSSSTSTSTSTSRTTSSSAPAETTPIVPIAPTSLQITTQTSSAPTTLTLGPCPTGFYACSAYFNLGACCQVGRDCGRTSCPPLITSTALVSNGVTIAGVSPSGLCATGWSSCAAGVGGGCCPTGYGCGTQVCQLTATSAGNTAASVVPKQGGAVAVRGRISGSLGLASLMIAAVIYV